jgi:phosphatidylethanolamine/phosphatidyl-N-methylethanolamine N-methyltransferase
MSRSDFALFMGQMARRPHQVVGLAPSSRFLCAEMVAGLDPDGGPVIELGAGTGNITRPRSSAAASRRSTFIPSR